MLIVLKNKDKLIIDDFEFKCVIGKKGLTKRKYEGDLKTPSGKFKIGNLYFRKDRIQNPFTNLKKIKIKKKFGWCNDIKSNKYNKRVNISKKHGHEKLYRKDHKYDLFIPIKYNDTKIIPGKGSAIFLHITENYKPTDGCIAISKKNFLIMLKLINKKTKILIS